MKNGKRRGRMRLFFLAALLFAVSGCVQESNENGERIYQYQLWVPLTVLVAGLVAIPIGLVLRRRTAWLGWGLVVIGPVAAVIFAPSLFRDRVVVSSERFHVQTGIWGLTAVHSLEFAEIKEIRITAETTNTRRGGKRTNYYLNCDKKAGGSSKVPVNNAVTEAAAEAILREATAHRIPIRDETGGQ